ncbi:hypothetical protein BCF74_105152 [Knoellia remsis]|uniref:Actinobacteria/chloroflexi VLRF1 release factor domain-containing protein n=1 Tax=Knoellia remsis TaxID=407159 RepID=A0A2T0UUK6_9MICO|nr:hypothetical protein BCF74_105152 [Knoellia remsis]
MAPERYAAWRERFDIANHDGPQRILSVETFEPRHLAVVLVRRGGYAVARVDGSTLVAHKVGTRHVQSRTAAGGWSQQRFARRRGNQADELVRAVADHAARVLGLDPSSGTAGASAPRPFQSTGQDPSTPWGLVVGGDRALVRDVLTDPRLRRLEELPRREFHDIGDPKRAVLDDVLRRARAVRVTIDDGPGT